MPSRCVRVARWTAVLTPALACASLVAQQGPPEPPAPVVLTEAERDSLAERLDQAVLTAELGQFWGAVLVLADGRPVLSQGYGYASAALEPITSESLFDIGSIAKQFTAAAILRLQARGVLTLDDTLGQLVERCPPAASAITLRQLLVHTSGLSNSPPLTPADLETAPALLHRVLSTPLASRPGERFSYNNVGYFVLAAVIETVDPRGFEGVLREEVFAPAGMAATGFVGDRTLDASRATARVFDFGSGPVLATALDYNWNWGNRGATGIITSAADLARWTLALDHDDFLTPELRGAMFEPGPSNYGLGWVIEQSPLGLRQSHGGSTAGYAARIARYPERNVSIIILSNGRTDVVALERRLARLVMPPQGRTLTVGAYLMRHPPGAGGVVDITGGLQWMVMPRYVGRDEQGQPVTDERATLVLTHPESGMWVLMSRMDLPVAEELLAALDAALRDPRAQGDPAAPGAPISAQILTANFELGPYQNIDFPPESRWNVSSSPGAVRLELAVPGQEAPPAAVTMSPREAAQLAAQIRGILGITPADRR